MYHLRKQRGFVYSADADSLEPTSADTKTLGKNVKVQSFQSRISKTCIFTSDLFDKLCFIVIYKESINIEEAIKNHFTVQNGGSSEVNYASISTENEFR